MSRQLRAKNIQTRLEASQGFAIHFLVSKAVPATENKKKEKHIIIWGYWKVNRIKNWWDDFDVSFSPLASKKKQGLNAGKTAIRAASDRQQRVDHKLNCSRLLETILVLIFFTTQVSPFRALGSKKRAGDALLFLYQTPLVACPRFWSSPPTKSLQQATLKFTAKAIKPTGF